MCGTRTWQQLERQTAQHTAQHNGGALFLLSLQGVQVQEQQVQHSTRCGFTLVAYFSPLCVQGIPLYSKIKRDQLL